MNNDFLVSIIVPIYNVEEYLDDCLNSISTQLYKKLQIILVNDGSNDGSAFVAKKYVLADNRFSLYSKPNGGLSSARNFGIDKAIGDFICFIDSDDYISDDYISDFISIFNRTNADVVVSARYNMYNNVLFKSEFDSMNEIHWTGKEALINMLNWQKVDGSVCDKIFKMSFFSSLRFKIGAISEDLPITTKIFSESNLIIHSGKPKYFYRQRDGSITKQLYNSKKLTILDSAEEVYIIVASKYPELTLLGKKFILHHVHYLISIYFRTRYLNKDEDDSFHFVKREFFKLLPIYYLSNNRNVIKKSILLIIFITNTQKIIRKAYHSLISKRD
jgi:glycosyltransferase involved in cell wall biosynthesis